MTEEKKIEILAIINAEWDKFSNLSEMAREIEHAYIFGPLGENEHYNIDDISALIKEVLLEKSPVIIEE